MLACGASTRTGCPGGGLNELIADAASSSVIGDRVCRESDMEDEDGR